MEFTFFFIIELNGLHMIYTVVYGASTGSYMIIIPVKTLFMVTKTYLHKVVLRCVCEYSNAKSGNINSHSHRKIKAYITRSSTQPLSKIYCFYTVSK